MVWSVRNVLPIDMLGHQYIKSHNIFVPRVTMQIGLWLGLSHTFGGQRNGGLTVDNQGCQASAEYTKHSQLIAAESDAVRDTPPQPSRTGNRPYFFSCDAQGGVTDSD